MDTFCVLPWFGTEFNWMGHQSHCCLLPDSYNVEEIRAKMLAGERPSACQKCWNLEDQGIRSDRQIKNEALDYYWDRDLEFIKQDVALGNFQPRMLQMMTSYTCNAACATCGPGASSTWSQLERKSNRFIELKNKSYQYIDLDQVKHQVDFKELKTMNLLGGEPLYEKRNFELLEYIIDLGNTDLFLSFVTNGSVALTDRQKAVLSKFKNLNFSISIDGVGNVFEYIRYPLKWNDLNDNLKFFREVTDNISTSYTISNLNVLYHNQTTEWLSSQGIVFHANPVYNPKHFQTRSLPASVKTVLKNTLNDNDYRAYVGEHTEIDDANFLKFVIEIKRQEQLKQIKLQDYMPKLFELIEMYF